MTLTAALARLFRKEGRRVGIVAVDPSSPFSGGAILGDRIRMQDLYTDPDVLIRSMATRGHEDEPLPRHRSRRRISDRSRRHEEWTPAARSRS